MMKTFHDEISFEDGTVMLVADAAPFSTRDVWDGFSAGLHDNGIHVLPYPTFSILEYLSPNLLGNDLLGKAMDVRNAVNAVVFVSGWYFRDRQRWVVESLTHHGVPTIMIATDDPYHPIETDGEYLLTFSNERSYANDQVGYLPMASSIPPLVDDSPFTRDLVFVGTIFEDRAPMIEKIAMYCELNGYRFDIYGHLHSNAAALADLDHVHLYPGTVLPEKKWEIYSQSRLVLNLFRDPGDSLAESASPRVYEVTAFGRPALITDYREECEEIFGDSVYLFRDFEQFQQQFERSLDSESDRMARVTEAQQIALKAHLYQHRAKQLIDEIKHKLDSTGVN